MKIENQVVNLELSKKLEELGVRYESYFLWVNQPFSDNDNYKVQPYFQENSQCNYLAAYTIAELGELLPKGTWLNVFFHSLEVQVQDKCSNKIFTDKSEVNVRAKLIIYLIESNLLKL